MDKKIFLQVLDKMSKKEIINFFEEAYDTGCVSTGLLNMLTPKKETEEELCIVTKILNSEKLDSQELEMVQERIAKKENTKIASLLKSNNTLDKAITTKKVDYCFTVLWSRYPRKVGKEQGRKAFLKLIENKKLKELIAVTEYIAQKIDEYCDYINDSGTEEQYIMHFSTFCNSKKYL